MGISKGSRASRALAQAMGKDGVRRALKIFDRLISFPKRFKDKLIGLFIITHVILIAAWAVPTRWPWVESFNHFTTPYVAGIGLWQGWDMFAPDPVTINRYIEAEILYSDGVLKNFDLGRMEKLPLFERYGKERYRKWANDSVRIDSNSVIWPDTALYVARIHDEPVRHPRKITLVRHWAEIPNPDIRFYKVDDEITEGWSKYSFYTYEVSH